MKRKLISSLVLSSIIAFGVQAEDFTGSIYIKDATIAPGGTATLSVQLENNIDVAGFQFDMKLPEGISYSSWGLSEERLPSGATTSDCAKSQSFENQIFKCAMALSYGAGAAYTGTSGEVAIITIEADAAAAEGTYTVELENVVVGFPSNANVKIDGTSFTLTVKTPTFEEGYAVEILPFAFKGDLEIPFVMDNALAIADMEFDVVMPSVLADNEICYTDKVFAKTKFDFDSEVNSDGIIHVSVVHKGSNMVAAGEGENIAVLGLIWNNAIPAGVYPVTIENIVLADSDGNIHLAAPYTTEIFVGDAPKATVADGVTAFHGNYGGADEYALLTAALPEGAMVDLTEVSAMAEDPTTLKTNNVIVTADAVAYGRTLPNAWGTLCLPFAIETNDNIQLYEFSRATSTGLFFEKITSAAANTPLIFKATGEDFSVKIANDGTFEVGYANLSPNLTPSVDNWVVNGSYINETVDVSSLQAYALYEGEFRRVTSRINVKAFHAWLQNNGDPMGAAIRISEGTDGIDIIEQEDGSIKLIYDMHGRQLKNGEGQQIYIENGKKVISINN